MPNAPQNRPAPEAAPAPVADVAYLSQNLEVRDGAMVLADTWSLWVPVPGRPRKDWPDHTWPAGHRPSLQERVDVLATLGYRPNYQPPPWEGDISGGWQWVEADPDPVPLRMFGRLTVCPLVVDGTPDLVNVP